MRLLTLMQYVDTCWLYGSAFTNVLSWWKGLSKQTYRFLHFNLKYNKVKHLYLWWSCFEPLQRRTYLLEIKTLVTRLPRLLTYSATTEIIVWYTNKFKVKWNFSTNILHKCFHFFSRSIFSTLLSSDIQCIIPTKAFSYKSFFFKVKQFSYISKSF